MTDEKGSSELILSSIIQAPDHHTAEAAIAQVFSLEYAYLRPFYLPAWTIFNRSHQSNIISRDWLMGEIESFLNETDRGLFLLKGPGGTGKTTFLAQLASRYGAIHHFTELAPGPKSIQSARCNLGAQIIRAFDMADFMPIHRFQEAVLNQDFLSELLIEGTQRYTQSNPDQKIMIILDGLEEAGISLNRNPFGIPEKLPRHVYLLTTQDPNLHIFNYQGLTKIVDLEKESSSVLSDLRAYFHKYFEDGSLKNIYNQLGSDPLCDILLGKSLGNWISLNHLLRQLNDPDLAKLSPDELLSQLPSGLSKTYLQTFLRIKDSDHAEWYRFILPIIGVFAVYHDPLLPPQIASYAGLPADYRLIKSYVDHSLQPFLTNDFQGRYYFPQHTLKDFLSGKMKNGSLSLYEETFLEELVENTRLSHLCVAQEILSLWGGLEAGLPGIKSQKANTARDEYGFDYLVSHLEGSGLTDDLRKLLRLEWQFEGRDQPNPRRIRISPKKMFLKSQPEKLITFANGWYTAKRSHNRLLGYLDDIHRAWNISNDVGEQARYALITSSVSMVASQPNKTFTIGDLDEQDQLIARLAGCLSEAGDPGKAMNTVEMIKNPRRKSQALTEVAKFLPSQSMPIILRLIHDLEDNEDKTEILIICALHYNELSKPVQALEICRAISEDTLRNELFVKLATKLIEKDQVELALEAVHNIKDESIQVQLITDYARNLDREELQSAMALMRNLHKDDMKVKAIESLAPYLPNPLHRDCFQCIRLMKEEYRSNALVRLIPHIREPLLKDALSAVLDIKDENIRAPVLVELVIRTAATGSPDKALKHVPAILGEKYQALAIAGISSYLTEEQCLEALEMGKKFTDEANLARTYEGLIPYLQQSVLKDILEKAFLFKNSTSQGVVLKSIAKRYGELGEQNNSVEIICQCPSQEQRSQILVEMAPLWHEDTRSEALKLTLELNDYEYQALALAGLLPYLSKAELIKALTATINLPNQRWLYINRRTENLCKIIPLLAECGEIDLSISTMQVLQDDESLAQALISLVPKLSGEGRANALANIRRIQSPGKRVDTLIDLAPMLPASQLDEILNDLTNFLDEKTRVNAIVRLAPSIPDEYFQPFLEIILKVQDRNIRVQAWSALVQRWLLLPVPQSMSLWKKTIQDLSYQPRSDLLLDLKSLVPVINDLGGINEINEVLEAIKDVARWWK